MLPPGDLMLMWRKDDQLVALHDQVLTTNGRLSVEKVEEGSLLSVMLAEREDGGVYSCQPSALQSLLQPHNVLVRGQQIINSQVTW